MSVSMRCDSHVHVIGPIARYPQLPDRTYLAGPAPLEDLRRAAETRSISRFVIVQPSFYGTDNTLLLEALDTLRANGKGVAVIDPASARSDMLASYAARGVCGLRINLYSLLGKLEARLDRAFAALEAIARDMGWHVEVIAPIQILAEHSALLAKARVPVVIDHYGVYGAHAPQSTEGARLLELLSHPHVWMKLSAPYRVSDDPLETRPNKAWLTAMLAVAAERCVWGSDWPHTPPNEDHKGPSVPGIYRALPYERLVDDFETALGSRELKDQIMRDNPARLYGF
jgi:predicted TIM-barrel fold metal-dependent hydrolase